MGIQLDWQIDSEQAQQRATEDPNAKRFRRKRRRNLALAMLAVAAVFGSTVGFVLWRLDVFENDLEQDLRDTVQVEITAIRLGNFNNFMEVQRSASQEWLASQERLFYEYQQLKGNGQLQSVGEVVDIEIDIEDSRARVVIEEEINGVPYQQVWFYWLYTDEDDQSGWRHVPPDETFWGETKRIKRQGVTIEYSDLDARMANALAPQIENWWNAGCLLLNCSATFPPLTVQIVSEPLNDVMWDVEDANRLLVPSPFLKGRVRNDMAYTPELERRLAESVSERLIQTRVNSSFNSTFYYTDGYWLYGEYRKWLTAQFIGESTQGSSFLQSLTLQFGEVLPGQLAAYLNETAQLGILQVVIGQMLPEVGVERLNAVDWREYFEWRLALERTTLLNGHEAVYRELYDAATPNAMNAAEIRRNQFDSNKSTPSVSSVAFTLDAQGNFLAYVTAQAIPDDTTNRETIIFRWVETTWKRMT